LRKFQFYQVYLIEIFRIDDYLMKENDALLDVENQICFAIYTTSNAIMRTYRPLLEDLGLTYPQYITMLVIWKDSPISVKKIGNKLNLDSGTLTPLLKRLEQRGLVDRVRNQSDERIVEIYLTEEGKDLKKAAQSIPEKFACALKVDYDEANQILALHRSLFERLSS
jgi:Transcriptional regulators